MNLLLWQHLDTALRFVEIMDALKRPLRIPVEFSRYAEEKEIFELYERMLKELLIHRPADPLTFLHEFLSRKNDDVPKVIVYGPPVSGRCTVSKLVARKLKSVHVSAMVSLQEDRSQEGLQARGLKEAGKEIPDQLWAKVIRKRLTKDDCKRRGWVLEGFPKTRLQALALQMEGILVSHFVHLTLPDAVLIERYSGKRVDPITRDVYHQVFVPPKSTEVAQRLIQEPGGLEENVHKPLALYHRHCQSLLSCYQKVLKTFNSDQPIGDLFAQVYTFLCTVGRTCAPRIPRVLLIGPTGSGKSLQAAQLARAYKMVEVDCKLLIKQSLASGTKDGLAMKPFHDRGMLIPDDMVMAVLSKHLSQLDVMTRGYVLHGFPLNRNQAELLAQSGHNPNRVFFLNIPEESIEERLTLRRLDPETGEKFHLLFKPPPSQEVKDRLQIHPKFTREDVLKRIGLYNRNVEDLMVYYDWGQHVNADQDPLTVFEYLESHLIESLPKQPPPSLEELSASVNL